MKLITLATFRMSVMYCGLKTLKTSPRFQSYNPSQGMIRSSAVCRSE
jgi:hypothetical protein